MDNAGQGFLSFDRDMMISNEYSGECIKIFRREIGGANYLDLMNCYVNKEKRSIVGSVFESVFRNNMSQ